MNSDTIVMSKDRLIEEADKIIFSTKQNYKSLESVSLVLPGATVMSEMIDILNELRE